MKVPADVIDKEAKALATRFEGINRAAWARDHNLKGGQALIYQHIKGIRPISMEAGMVYASGFGCALKAISARLANEAERVKAHATQSDLALKVEAPIVQYARFPAEVQEVIDLMMSVSADGRQQILDGVRFVVGSLSPHQRAKHKRAG
jgi:hypothetical protein